MHIPGNNPNKRHVPKPSATQSDGQPKIQAYFAEEDFIPCRGMILVECRFLGHSDVIHLDHLHEQQQHAIVRAVGEPRVLQTGVEIPNEYQPGDFVYAAVSNPNVRRIEIGNRKLALMPMDCVLGKFKEMPAEVLQAIKAQEEREAAEEAAKAAKIAASQQPAQ